MKPYIASLINAIVLIVFGLWAYFGSDDPSKTALIPVAAGIILLVLNIWMKKGSSVVAHIVVVLTLLILIALFKPLIGAIGRSDWLATTRVLVMILSTLFALTLFIKSFVDARRSR